MSCTADSAALMSCILWVYAGDNGSWILVFDEDAVGEGLGVVYNDIAARWAE